MCHLLVGVDVAYSNEAESFYHRFLASTSSFFPCVCLAHLPGSKLYTFWCCQILTTLRMGRSTGGQAYLLDDVASSVPTRDLRARKSHWYFSSGNFVTRRCVSKSQSFVLRIGEWIDFGTTLRHLRKIFHDVTLENLQVQSDLCRIQSCEGSAHCPLLECRLSGKVPTVTLESTFF